MRDKWIDDEKHIDIADDAEDGLKELALCSEDVYDIEPKSGLCWVIDYTLTMCDGTIITGFRSETDRLEVSKDPNINYCPHCGRKLD